MTYIHCFPYLIRLLSVVSTELASLLTSLVSYETEQAPTANNACSLDFLVTLIPNSPKRKQNIENASRKTFGNNNP